MQNQRKKLTVPQDFWNNFILMPLFSVIICLNLAIIANVKLFGMSLWTVLQPGTVAIIGFFELLFAAWMIIIGRIMVHRTAGPMISLKRGLNSIGEGNMATLIRFRKNDFHKEVADVFNENIEKIRQQVETVKQLADQLNAELPEAHSSREIAQKLQQQLVYFHTDIEFPNNENSQK